MPAPRPAATDAHYLLLHMADVARKVCPTVGEDVVGNIDGAEQISNILRNRFAPAIIDCIFQDITKFFSLRRTTQDMDPYLLEEASESRSDILRQKAEASEGRRLKDMEFDILRQKAEARVSIGTGFPGEFASALCMQNASLSKNERRWRPSLSSVHAAAQMRRFLEILVLLNISMLSWRREWTLCLTRRT